MAAVKEKIEQTFPQFKMDYRIIEQPSINYSNEEITPQFIIIHCIGFDENSALKILTKPVSEGGGGVSSHFFIPQGIKQSPYPIYNIVPDNKKAWHAGVSNWGKTPSLNNCSIGIEFHSPNYARALQVKAGDGTLDWFHFEEFTEAQISAGIQLIHHLMKKYNIKPENVLGHSDIAPYREDSGGNIILGKTDPGLTFPWEKLAKAGICVWPKSSRTRSGKLDTSLKATQLLLATYGYSVPVTGILDLRTQHVIKAFQMHFMPKHSDGRITAEMIIYLENLIDHQFDYCNKPSHGVQVTAEYTPQFTAASPAVNAFSNLSVSTKPVTTTGATANTGSNLHFSKMNTVVQSPHSITEPAATMANSTASSITSAPNK